MSSSKDGTVADGFPGIREKYGLCPRSLRCDWSVVWIVIGLSVVGAWTNLVGHSGTFLHANGGTHLAYQLGSMVCISVFLVIPRVVRRYERVTFVGVPVAMAVATALYGLAHYQTLFDPAAMSLGCCGVLGASYAWFVLTFYVALARRSTLKVSLGAIVVAAVAEQLVATGLNALLDELGQVMVCVLLPAVGAVCLAGIRRHRAKEHSAVLCSASAERYQLFLVVAIGIASITLSKVSSTGSWGDAQAGFGLAESFSLTFFACMFMVVLAHVFVGKFLERPLAMRYQPALLVIVAAYAFDIFVLPALPPFVAGALDLGFEFYGHVIRWVVAIDAVQHLRFETYRVMGFTLVMGPTMSVLWRGMGDNLALVGGTVLIVAYGIVLFVSLAPLMTGRPRSRGWLEAEDLVPQALEGDPSATGAVLMKDVRKRCVYLSHEYGLTGREGEVLELLACGRTRALIQEDLALSESTVKTHIKHIYGKFEVANVTELMGVVFSER